MRLSIAFRVAVLLAAVACAGKPEGSGNTLPTDPGNPYGPGGGDGGGGGGEPTQIGVYDTYFSPAQTTVSVNSTVTWTFLGATEHTVTFQSGESSAPMATGTFARAFTTAGTYTYLCTIHAGMTGSVIVH